MSSKDFENIARLYNESVLGNKDKELINEMDVGGMMGGTPTSGGALENSDSYAPGDTRIPKMLGSVQTRNGETKKKKKKKSTPKKPTKKKSKMYWEEDEEDPCWDGYNQRGTKEKNGKKVPNCVPEEDAEGECTKPTKKTSSSAKGKKWTKCAKQADGSVKRIHWGQKGVKVTGDSGNTKRKKSFRARHNCDNAKKGSAQEAACNDW